VSSPWFLNPNGPVALSELVSVLQAARSARLERPAVPLALATLVAVDGSSYRQPGARMLCDADGRVLAGAISGGCLEGDVARRAAAVCASGHGTVMTYDLREDLETIWGFGSGCDGVAHILLAPLTDLSPLEDARLESESRGNGVLLLIVESGDPQRVGALCFVRDAAPALATMPAVSARVQDTVRHTDRPYLGEQTTASGAERVFGSPVRPPVHVIVVGASRGAESLARVAHAVGWGTTVVDHRSEVLESLALPNGSSRRIVAAEHAASAVLDGSVVVDARTMFALCTHRFDHDQLWLETALATESPYIGVLGSRQRATRLVRTLVDAGRPPRARDRARLFAPIGLDIGGDSPDDIGLAAVAEMQAVLESRPGGSLRERTAPMHARSDTPQQNTDTFTVVCQNPLTTPRDRR